MFAALYHLFHDEPHGVSLTKDAERDLEEIYFYIAEHDSRDNAD
jgi:plasmid stabilization system protein ParE